MKEDNVKNNKDQYISDGELISTQDGMNLAVWTIGSLTSIVLLLIIWSSLTSVQESAIAPGQVVTKDPVQNVQHLEGGIVKGIYIRDGQHISKGDLMLSFESAAAKSELEQMLARKFTLELDIDRLRAYADDNVDNFKNKLSSLDIPDTIRQTIADEMRLLEMQTISRDHQRDVLNSQIAQEHEQIVLLNQEKDTLTDHINLLKDEKKMYDNLGNKSHFSKREYLRLMRDINNSQGQLSKIIGEIRLSRKELQEKHFKLNELNTSLKEKAVADIGELHAKLVEVDESIEKLQDRVDRLKLFAPFDGIVKGIEVTFGSVVPPGGKLFDLVPLESPLIVEAKISTKDIGHVSIGDKAKIKISTFDYAKYGGIDGILTNISATTFSDDKGNSYYEGKVQLAQNHLGSDPLQNKLLPGMSVNVDLNTGSKTIMQYLLKPITRGFDMAFTER